MQKTVREIIDMIDSGELRYDQTTQRGFIYKDMEVKLQSGNVTTRSGALLNSILEKGIILPAVYFWKNTDTGTLNIHDGKQRLLSIYYFVKPNSQIAIQTILGGKAASFGSLKKDQQDYLLDYRFDVVEREGSTEEEEESFWLINTNGVPLTDYECLSGMYYGPFLTEFEEYLSAASKSNDFVKKIGRGEQAYKFLLTMLGITTIDDSPKDEQKRLIVNDRIRAVREQHFSEEAYSMGDIISLAGALSKAVKGLKEDKCLAIAKYAVMKGYDSGKIEDVYRRSARKQNDIAKWDNGTHKTFIEAYIGEGLELDPQRRFFEDVKNALYSRNPRCSHVDEDGKQCRETNYSKLEVDHVVPWSKGGQTVLDNAQLLCKAHNSGKGNRG